MCTLHLAEACGKRRYNDLIGRDLFEKNAYADYISNVVNDGMAAIVDYTIEKEGGVDLLNYSQLDNEAKGAFTNEEQSIKFEFCGGHGKTFVNLEKSTSDKLYCTDYLLRDNTSVCLTLEIAEYDAPLKDIYVSDVDPDDHLLDEKSVAITFAGTISNKTFESTYGEIINISPVSMKIGYLTDDTLGEGYEEGYCYQGDYIGKILITYKDGSEYLVYRDIIFNGLPKHEYGEEIETHPIVTTETSEDPTTTTTESTTTTTTTDNTSAVNITPGKTMDVGEFCYLMVNTLGSHYNDATSALNSYSSIPLEEYYTGDYDDEKWIMYNCAIGVGSVIFDICDVSFYTTDGKVYSLDFSATITEGDAKEAYDYLVSQISAAYGNPVQHQY